MDRDRPSALAAEVKARALALGFDDVAIVRAEPPDPDGRFAAWLDRGFHGSMSYMEKNAATRADPSLWVEGARSVVAVAMSYHHPDASQVANGKVARYARGADYHQIIRRKILKLRSLILRLAPGATVAPSIDYAPVLERAWAARAGLGWIGKSSMLISRRLGTYTFLATLMTDVELEPDDRPVADHCGTCTACIDACPTGAIVAPRDVDARRCITYWTIEERGAFDETTPAQHGWLAGCDVCQEVCPWNKFAKPTSEPRFTPRPELDVPDLVKLATDHAAAEAAILGTALQRTGAEAIQRNARRLLEEQE